MDGGVSAISRVVAARALSSRARMWCTTRNAINSTAVKTTAIIPTRRPVPAISMGRDGRRRRAIASCGGRLIGWPQVKPFPQADSARADARRPRRRYMTGTKTNLANVAKESPQMTARASGAFCSSLANTERHGYHAQDHRACSHEHRPQSRKSRDLAPTQELSLASIGLRTSPQGCCLQS